ncbi:phosphatase PAP2 family protein [soil metagenome]
MTVLSKLRPFGWREFVILLTALALCSGLWIFFLVTDQVMDKGPHRLDNQILLSLRQPDHLDLPIGPAWVKPAALDLTALGSAPVLTVLVLLICGYLLLERKFTAASLIFFATSTGALLSNTLKYLVDRERPTVVPHLAEFSRMSFPSGHSMLSAVVYLTLAVLLAQTLDQRRSKIYLISAALFLAFLVGLTRLILGVHYPTDVIAGWTAGTVWALLCWLAATRLPFRGLFQRKA